MDLLVFGLAAFIIISAVGLIWISTLEIPDLSAFEERRVLQSTKIYDRTGEILLYDLHQDVRRTIVPFDEMSPFVRNATIAIEDDQFYNHIGIDFMAIIRSMVINLQKTGDPFSGVGGSTITQQVIKNSVLDRDKNLTRKVKEAILSIKLERVMEKDQILEVYLNEAPYGGTIYGVEEAAQSFFGKKAIDLTLPEAAYLAAIPQAPTYFSPYGSHRADLDERQQLVLDRMRLNGFITVDQYNEAKDTTIEFQPQAVTGIRAPHFVMYVVEQLAEKYGEEAMAEQGFRIITTLDWDLQKEAEKIVAQKVASNTEKYNATNGGLVAVDPKTGDLLTMVGSRDYFSEDIDGNFNVTLAPRQPGSSIKPFVYANAFRKGYLPQTVLFDVPTQFSPQCEPDSQSSESPCYAPQNYNHKFVGPISMRNALAQSLNIPAVKTLYLAGLKDTLKFAADMGLTTLNDPDRYGLTLVLGGGEVRLVDMTYAYSVFANAGLKTEPRTILKVEDSRGNVIDEPEVQTHRVLEENVAYMISDVLSDNVARTPLWGNWSIVNFGERDVAVKSGSTNNLRDAWIMGYAPNIAVGAWCGNNDNAAMGGGLSGLITTPMWRAFMDVALAKLPNEEFPEPEINTDGLKPVLRGEYIDTAALLEAMQSKQAAEETNNTRPNRNNRNDTNEDEINSQTIDVAAVYNNIHSILHFVNRDDPTGGYPANPASDPQYENWEYGVQKWNQETFGLLLGTTTPSEN
ncbi:penicillin-binding protein [Candidatus Kaiserbacteria bacterium]|nr:penicillin-binding protein [Candidatus Kaiserbacteria bacterium]USN89132.1 MAG: penicillin-binding protein [Candidatus Nomurabacteria bacterium]